MEGSLDTIGENFVQASFESQVFKKEFKFLVKIELRARKKIDPEEAKAMQRAAKKKKK